MADTKNISDLDISSTGTVTAPYQSIEQFLMRPSSLKTANVTKSDLYGGGNIEVSNSGLDPYLVSETTKDDSSGPSAVPQLSDISVFKKETYLDSKGVTRGRVILKVNNSSGQKLLGVDTKMLNLNEVAG